MIGHEPDQADVGGMRDQVVHPLPVERAYHRGEIVFIRQLDRSELVVVQLRGGPCEQVGHLTIDGRKRLLAINADDIRAIAARRQVGHWASLDGPQSPEAPRKALHDVYDALVAAADFYALRNIHKAGFD
jgi:hypothetical protein